MRPCPPKALNFMFSDLQAYFEGLAAEQALIEPTRKIALRNFAEELLKKNSSHPLAINFICTHNSRRSHFASIWSALSLRFLGVEGIQIFSGGTEATAVHPNAVAALKRAGLRVSRGKGENPRYEFYFSEEEPPIVAFSKRFDDPTNPRAGFIAVMTCSEADAGCPIVPGAIYRFSLPFEDPKLADGIPDEAIVYDDRCRQIAREMLFLFSHLVDENDE
jgi:arsenate reductase